MILRTFGQFCETASLFSLKGDSRAGIQLAESQVADRNSQSHNQLTRWLRWSALLLVLFSAGCAGKLPFIGDRLVENAPSGGKQQPIVPPPNADAPVQAGALVHFDEDKRTLSCIVRIRIADGYYLHDFDPNNPSVIPVSVSTEMPQRLGEQLKWENSGSSYEHGLPVFRNELVMRSAITTPEAVELPRYAKLVVRFQACSENSCRQPEKIELVAEVESS